MTLYEMEVKGKKVVNPLKGDIRSGVRLPKIDQHASPSSEKIEASMKTPTPRPRSTFMAYGKTLTLKLPELASSRQQALAVYNNNLSSKLGTRESTIPSPRSRLTKQEMIGREVAEDVLENKKSNIKNMEIDKKLMTMNRSLADFEKKYRDVNDSLKDAVRRSAADSRQNRSLMTSSLSKDGKSDPVYEKYVKEIEQEEMESRLSSASASPRSCPKIFGLDPMNVLESSESSTDSDSESSERIRRLPQVSSSSRMSKTKRKVPIDADFDEDEDEDENVETTKNPVMPKASDKAFLTKLKKWEGQTNKNLQQMQNQLTSIHQKVEIDRKKANLEANKNKPLYNPRRNINTDAPRLIGSTIAKKGPRTELIDFVQANGGRTGSWKPEDHSKFLMAYKQHKDDPEKLIDITMQHVKSKTAKEVMAHVKWYEQYDSLSKANKDQLRKWDMEKRQDREMIYQMASEGQRTKLENEKRRQEHLKNKREEERLRSRASLSEWKKSKVAPDESSQLKTSLDMEYNVNNIQKEMLVLAEKIQKLNTMKSKTLKPPRPFSMSESRLKRNALRTELASGVGDAEFDINNMPADQIQKEDLYSKKLSLTNEKNDANQRPRIFTKSAHSTFRNHSHIQPRESKIAEPIVQIDLSTNEDQISTQNESNSDTKKITLKEVREKFPNSKLTKETYSHKIHKETQKCKRMELLSQRGKIPNRMEESQLWESPTLSSVRSRKAIPEWKK